MDFVEEIEAVLPSLRRYAHALVRDRETADAMVEHCLRRALARRAEWHRGATVKLCLFRILLNRYRDVLREGPPRLSVVPAAAPAGVRRIGAPARAALGELQEAIGRLPPDERAALLLVQLEGMRFDEAAHLLAIPPGTLIARLARARAALRQMTEAEPPARSAAG